MDLTTGHEENRKIGNLLSTTPGVKDWLVNDTGWDCLYDQIIGDNPDGTGPENMEEYHDYRSRESAAEQGTHVVSTRHVNKMVQQLTRLINKYSALDPETGIDWASSEQAQFLVTILSEHRVELEAELSQMDPIQVWAHPPKPNWVVFPMCGAESEAEGGTGRRVWDYAYPHENSGLVYDMFPTDA